MKPFLLIACVDDRHELCDGCERGSNRRCDCRCHQTQEQR